MSFHNNFEKWLEQSKEETCPKCGLGLPPPPGNIVIKDFEYSHLMATSSVCLKGQCCLVLRSHAVELFDMNESTLLGFMKEAQTVSRILKKITKAIKINYEIHGNSAPHLHMHLFPRYLDDPFPGQPINYNRIDPTIYKENEFNAFIREMKEEIEVIITEFELMGRGLSK